MSTTAPEPIIAKPRRCCGRWGLVLWGAALLIAGIGIGVGGTLLIHPKPPPPPPPPGVPDFRPGPIVERMTRELNLTPDQTKKVNDAYAERLEAIKGLRSDMVVKLSAEHEKLRDAMKRILTVEQFAQWDQNFEAMRSRLMPDAPPPPRGPREGGPPPQGPPGDGRGPDPLGRGQGGPGGPGRLPPIDGGGENGPGPGGPQEPPPGPR